MSTNNTESNTSTTTDNTQTNSTEIPSSGTTDNKNDIPPAPECIANEKEPYEPHAEMKQYDHDRVSEIRNKFC